MKSAGLMNSPQMGWKHAGQSSAEAISKLLYMNISGEPAAVVDAKLRVRLVGDLQSELVADFFDGFARGAQANVHARILYGRSNHHKIEALFKAFARALRAACWRDKQMARLLPSTKGLL